jgi:hypothetical protein
LPTWAQAASVATPVVACKAEADSKKAFEFISKNDTAGRDKFKTSKITTGDCSSLPKGLADHRLPPPSAHSAGTASRRRISSKKMAAALAETREGESKTKGKMKKTFNAIATAGSAR